MQRLQAYLGALPLIGGAANLDILKTGGNYRIHFTGGLAGTPISLLLSDPTQLQAGAGMNSKLNVDDSGPAAKTGTIAAALAGATSLTYTPVARPAPPAPPGFRLRP